MSFIGTAIIMFAFWMLLSGHTEPLLVISGVLSSLLVAYLSHDLLVGRGALGRGLRMAYRIALYLPWLLWQIILANIDLVYLVLHPSMPIDPTIIRFKNEFRTDTGAATLANSITLTPGTVTIDVNDHEFIVHAISPKSARALLEGPMRRKTKEIEEGV